MENLFVNRFKSIVFILTIVLIFISCSLTSFADSVTRPVSIINITETNNGGTIIINRGTVVNLTLNSNPTTGYEWSYINTPDKNILNELEHTFISSAKEPNIAGAGGYDIWKYEAIKPGKTTISMKYSRSWENNPAVKTFLLNVVIQDDLVPNQSKVQVTPSISINDTKVKMNLSVLNNSENYISISHRTSQKSDFTLLDSSKKELYRWSKNFMFLDVLTYTTINPGTTCDFTIIDTIKKDILDNAVYMKGYITGTSNDFKIDPNGYEVNIYKIK